MILAFVNLTNEGADSVNNNIIMLRTGLKVKED